MSAKKYVTKEDDDMLFTATEKEAILQSGKNAILEAAAKHNAQFGSGTVSIKIDNGDLDIKSFVINNNDWTSAVDSGATYPGFVGRGISYPGFSAGKLFQSNRTKADSSETPTVQIDFGESNDEGNCFATMKVKGHQVEINSSYSGMETGAEDAEIANPGRSAMRMTLLAFASK